MAQPRSLQIIRDEHASLAAMLQSMRMLVDKGPGDGRKPFFDVLRAMLFYIDEYPERLHHPKESNLLFPKVVKASPKVLGPSTAWSATTCTAKKPPATCSTC